MTATTEYATEPEIIDATNRVMSDAEHIRRMAHGVGANDCLVAICRWLNAKGQHNVALALLEHADEILDRVREGAK